MSIFLRICFIGLNLSICRVSTGNVRTTLKCYRMVPLCYFLSMCLWERSVVWIYSIIVTTMSRSYWKLKRHFGSVTIWKTISDEWTMDFSRWKTHRTFAGQGWNPCFPVARLLLYWWHGFIYSSISLTAVVLFCNISSLSSWMIKVWFLPH